MYNLFEGFKLFEADFLGTIKKQVKVPKKLWFGMPLTIAANKTIKIDGKTFKGPMVFYVTEFDDATVTMKLVRNPMDFSNEDDIDDEIDFDNTEDGEEHEVTILRTAFEKLLQPDNPQGADFASASQAALSPR